MMKKLTELKPNIIPEIRVGVDVSILTQIANLYPTFSVAIKELVSNAFDADAQNVHIIVDLKDRFLKVEDDGVGLTPQDISSSLLRIGSSLKKFKDNYTKGGRSRIGCKGIGFLAPSNFCESIIIRSSTRKNIRYNRNIRIGKRGITFDEIIFPPIPHNLVNSAVKQVRINGIPVKNSSEVVLTKFNGNIILKAKKLDEYNISYVLDCNKFEIYCTINTDFFQSTKNNRDFRDWDSLVSIKVNEKIDSKHGFKSEYTIIELKNLKQYVVDELKRGSRKRKFRHIEGLNGIDSLMWSISRSIPINYDVQQIPQKHVLHKIISNNEIQYIQKVTFSKNGEQPTQLRRPVWHSLNHNNFSTNGMLLEEINIDSGGLLAVGYIQGSLKPIYPSEYRGLALRLSNVLIGSPSFMGFEKKLSANDRWVLKQLSGEIHILNGIDPLKGLTPDRAGFITDLEQYKILVEQLTGPDDTIGGNLGAIVERMKEYMKITRQVSSLVAKTTSFRETLLNISSAINNVVLYLTRDSDVNDIGNILKLDEIILAGKGDWPPIIPKEIDDFMVIMREELNIPYDIDFEKRIVSLSANSDIWKTNVFILGKHFDVVRKKATVDHSLCEFNYTKGKIYLNWTHPLRVRMGQLNFTRQAIVWKIAQQIAPHNPNEWMKVGLEILNYKEP